MPGFSERSVGPVEVPVHSVKKKLPLIYSVCKTECDLPPSLASFVSLILNRCHGYVKQSMALPPVREVGGASSGSLAFIGETHRNAS